MFPVADHDIGSVVGHFGDARDGGRRPHLGIDIAAPRGTPVVAVHGGTVDRIDRVGAGGLAVWLKESGSSRRHYFAHLQSIAVQRGQRVTAGELIGTVGTTGNAAGTSPHLHYMVRSANDILDPISLFGGRTSVAKPGSSGRTMYTHLNGAALKRVPGGATIAVLPINQPVTVLEKGARYYRVQYNGKTGYLARWLLEKNS